jgi:predicted amidohydrolase
MKIAVVSLDQKWEDKEYNLQRCRDFVQKAKEKNADLIIFPEMTLTGFSMNIDKTAEDPDNSDTVSKFKELAKEYDINIVFGVVFKSQSVKATNNLIMINPKGDLQVNYAKIHPFTYAGEDKFFEGGNILGLAKLNDLNIGFAICYDLRFPEMFAAMSKNIDLIIIIANWPAKRVDHWNALLKARAIENQCYIIGTNRIGIDGTNLEYAKSSRVINANGVDLKPIHSEAIEFDIYELDKASLNNFRVGFPTIRDKQTKLYKSIL